MDIALVSMNKNPNEDGSEKFLMQEPIILYGFLESKA